MSKIPKVSKIEGLSNRPANPDDRELKKNPTKPDSQKGEYYNPNDIVEISDEARERAKTEIDPE